MAKPNYAFEKRQKELAKKKKKEEKRQKKSTDPTHEPLDSGLSPLGTAAPDSSDRTG